MLFLQGKTPFPPAGLPTFGAPLPHVLRGLTTVPALFSAGSTVLRSTKQEGKCALLKAAGCHTRCCSTDGPLRSRPGHLIVSAGPTLPCFTVLLTWQSGYSSWGKHTSYALPAWGVAATEGRGWRSGTMRLHRQSAQKRATFAPHPGLPWLYYILVLVLDATPTLPAAPLMSRCGDTDPWQCGDVRANGLVFRCRSLGPEVASPPWRGHARVMFLHGFGEASAYW